MVAYFSSTLYFVFSDIIVCHFEDDLCNWEITGTDQQYIWQRLNAKQLDENGFESGPSGDHGEDINKFFMIATRETSPGSDGAVNTQILSPRFKIVEHPTECFGFWYQIGVLSVSTCTYRGP